MCIYDTITQLAIENKISKTVKSFMTNEKKTSKLRMGSIELSEYCRKPLYSLVIKEML